MIILSNFESLMIIPSNFGSLINNLDEFVYPKNEKLSIVVSLNFEN